MKRTRKKHNAGFKAKVALAGGLLGFTAMLPYITLLGLSVIAGFIVQGNFSNLTSGSSQSPLPSTGGRRSGCTPASALAPHSSARSGFGVTLDQFGGISQLAAWIVSFGTCGLACLAGAAATMFLPRDVWNDRHKLPARCLTKKPGW